MTLTANERDLVLHAPRAAAEAFWETAGKLERQGGEHLAQDFRRRASGMRVLADRIEQAKEVEF
jgi:hypothetical protein